MPLTAVSSPATLLVDSQLSIFTDRRVNKLDTSYNHHPIRTLHLSPEGYIVSCRFHGAFIVFLSVCKFVMSSVVHYEGGV